MRLSLLLFASLVAAVPYPQDDDTPEDEPAASVSVGPAPTTVIADPTVPVLQSTSLNVPVTVPSAFPTQAPFVNGTSSSHHHKSHWEPVPVFSKSCDCPNLQTVAYPCWATDSLQKCNFEELHSYVCWTSAAYGCPSPTRSCDALFTSSTLTGKNPCELGPNTGDPPIITDAPAITSGAFTSAPVITAAPMPMRRWQDMALRGPEKYGVRK